MIPSDRTYGLSWRESNIRRYPPISSNFESKENIKGKLKTLGKKFFGDEGIEFDRIKLTKRHVRVEESFPDVYLVQTSKSASPRCRSGGRGSWIEIQYFNQHSSYVLIRRFWRLAAKDREGRGERKGWGQRKRDYEFRGRRHVDKLTSSSYRGFKQATCFCCTSWLHPTWRFIEVDGTLETR